MAITNKLITFNKLSSFEKQLAAGNILSTSIVFIKDAKKIWTKGTYFDCSGGGIEIISLDYTMSSGTLTDEQFAIVTNSTTKVLLAEMYTPVGSYIYYMLYRVESSINVYMGFYFTPADISSKLKCLELIISSDKTYSFSYDNIVLEDKLSSFLRYDNQQAITAQGINNGNGMTYAVPGSDITDGGEFQDVLALRSEVGEKQDALVSGTNIKTINGQSILGSGNVTTPRNLTYVTNTATYGTVQLLPNTCIYMPTPLSSSGKLAINPCATISSNNAELIESRICFRMPDTVAQPTIQFNGVAIRWTGGVSPTFEAGFTYEISLFYPSNANSVGPMGVCVGFK